MKRIGKYKTGELVLSVPFVIKKTKSGYMAECLDLNIVTQGRNLKATRKNITEAINLHMKSASELGLIEDELEKLEDGQEIVLDTESDKLIAFRE